eukprot:TRINITY_DN77105_c0_g1_i1.p1 TRINITY_DN77105_c0_g1~~TRINITY_DN77105_c0_g1_i1.p1  ORF type:complete len:283 (+),score=72.96 TRINITY_DN77105_c0_g1_i1:88-936(+)
MQNAPAVTTTLHDSALLAMTMGPPPGLSLEVVSPPPGLAHDILPPPPGLELVRTTSTTKATLATLEMHDQNPAYIHGDFPTILPGRNGTSADDNLSPQKVQCSFGSMQASKMQDDDDLRCDERSDVSTTEESHNSGASEDESSSEDAAADAALAGGKRHVPLDAFLPVADACGYAGPSPWLLMAAAQQQQQKDLEQQRTATAAGRKSSSASAWFSLPQHTAAASAESPCQVVTRTSWIAAARAAMPETPAVPPQSYQKKDAVTSASIHPSWAAVARKAARAS